MAEVNDLTVGEPICIAATGDICGEGILWQASTKSIYWTDINRFLVHRYKLVDRTVRTWFFSEPVTCVLETARSNTLAVVFGSGVAFWEPETDKCHEPLFSLPGWPAVRCNDAAVDPNGILWLGTMRNNVKESGEPCEVGGLDGLLYRIDGTGAWSEWRRDIGIGNTLLWSPDYSRFYFGDSLLNQIYSYEYGESNSSIRSERPFFSGFERGAPDGSAMDADGYIWNCRYGGNCIVRVSPLGLVDKVIEMPIANPTNCAFGGEDMNILFVTSAAPESGKWERFGGCLLSIQTNVAGQPAHAFKV